MNEQHTVLQINVTANSGSTGRIAEQINQLAQTRGWRTYLAYGRDMQKSQSNLIRVGSRWQVYEHFIEGIVFDNDGLASRMSTKRFIRKVNEIKPNVIHLHNIHGHWINYKLLFEYLNGLDTPIVWTTHDPWPFTGCGHFINYNCNLWSEGGCTNGCPRKKSNKIRCLFEKTEKHFILKQNLVLNNKNLTIVPNSKWMEILVRRSFLKNKPIKTILNGIDIDVFKPTNDKAVLRKYGIDGIPYVLGVASTWNQNKGIEQYYKLATKLNDDLRIVLVGNGLKKSELGRFRIISIPRTFDVHELAAIYTGAKVVLNLSYQESFGLTSVEGFGCGKPTIVFNRTACPELVDDGLTGRVVEPYDIEGVVDAIYDLMASDQKRLSMNCRQRAIDCYDINKTYQNYITLYESILKKDSTY